MKLLSKSKPHEYLFKAMWGATALTIRVEASSYEEARKRAERMILKMEGGPFCHDIQFLKQTK